MATTPTDNLNPWLELRRLTPARTLLTRSILTLPLSCSLARVSISCSRSLAFAFSSRMG